MMKNIEDDDLFDVKAFMIGIVNLSEEVSQLSNKLHTSSKKTLYELDKDEKGHAYSDINFNIPKHDPGKRERIKCDDQRRYLLNIGPHQPKLRFFPKNDDITSFTSGRLTKRTQSFNPNWYDLYPHLEYSIEKDAAFCQICSLFGDEGEWTTKGLRSWHKFKSRGKAKKGKLVQHFTSEPHCAAVTACANFLTPNQHIDVMFDAATRGLKVRESSRRLEAEKIAGILLDVTKTLGRQGLAFRGSGSDENGNYRQIVNLVARHNPELNEWIQETEKRPKKFSYLSPQSQNEFINTVGNDLCQEIVKEVQDAKVYSIMADHTPDVSHQDRLAVVCRYVIGNEVKETLLSITQAKSKTGEGTASEIIQVLNSKGLDTADLAFQSYDFTSSMSGKFKGAQAKLQEMIGHEIPYIPCLAHRTNTVLEHACNVSSIAKLTFEVLESTYVFFTSSTKRSALLNEEVAEFKAGESHLSLVNLSKTRWTASARAVRAVWDGYEGIVSALETIVSSDMFDTKTKADAAGLHTKLRNVDFLVMLMFF